MRANYCAFQRFLSATLIIAVAGCTTSGPAPKIDGADDGRVGHVVVCWLKEPGDTKAQKQILDVSKSFSSIPGVISVAAGKMLPSERTIVDSSFDVAIVITFEDQKAMGKYLLHPDHVKAVRKVLQPLVYKLLVYDFIESE